MKKKITIEDITEELSQWQGDIECDIKNEETPIKEKWASIIVATQLAQAIGILKGLDHNHNIKYDTNNGYE